MSAGASPAPVARDAAEAAKEKKNRRTPLAELLHALNQPLTGLQCSLEVTLAAPRTHEYYVNTLHDGLALTERMRTLVEAVREVAEIVESKAGSGRATQAEHELDAEQLRGVLRESAEELKPVAEMKQVKLGLSLPGGFAARPCPAETRRLSLAQGIFRLLEAALALAATGTVLRIDGDAGANGEGFRVRWKTAEEEIRSGPSRPELGLLVAQARLEQSGALWERERSEGGETLTVRLPPA